MGFLGGSAVKNLPAMQETQVPSLGSEDPLEKGITTHSSILAWRILWTEKPVVLQSMGLQSGTQLSCYSHAFRETNSLRRTMQIVECSLLHRRAQGRVSSSPRTPTHFCENLIYPKCICPNPPPQIP